MENKIFTVFSNYILLKRSILVNLINQKFNTGIAPYVPHRQNNDLKKAEAGNSRLLTFNKSMTLPSVSQKLALLYFTGAIVPAVRLKQSNFVISSYIQEIGKARWLHGDRAVIDLSMGNPDITPPEKAKEALKLKVNDLWSHRYNNPKGEGGFLNEVSIWMDKRFGVKINPKTEVMATSGSADAVDHIFSAYANHGDKVLVPNPGYALYDDLIVRHD